ncbi:hypothetical protein [Fischerella sp. PCC 9605]|uniref:hypothetical protein n=1 Tax=Fischerella sp. PCC 9605 TaxID=1173024 RepID=UPI0012DCF1CF|nr:hypothetical protein [Fischerella sp. PCC 9605]
MCIVLITTIFWQRSLSNINCAILQSKYFSGQRSLRHTRTDANKNYCDRYTWVRYG